jgi:hypothetical protein
MNLPMHGVNPTHLEPEPEEERARLDAAAADGDAAALRAVAAERPTYLDAWARLAEAALVDGDPIAAYAFARTGYHRGLDAIRRAGWRGQGPVPWSHEPNRGFLRSVHALMQAAGAIGEDDEAQRCREFLLELDPDDHLAVRPS